MAGCDLVAELEMQCEVTDSKNRNRSQQMRVVTAGGWMQGWTEVEVCIHGIQGISLIYTLLDWFYFCNKSEVLPTSASYLVSKWVSELVSE